MRGARPGKPGRQTAGASSRTPHGAPVGTRRVAASSQVCLPGTMYRAPTNANTKQACRVEKKSEPPLQSKTNPYQPNDCSKEFGGGEGGLAGGAWWVPLASRWCWGKKLSFVEARAQRRHPAAAAEAVLLP